MEVGGERRRDESRTEIHACMHERLPWMFADERKSNGGAKQ